MKRLPTSVQKYHGACNELVVEFVEKYFGKKENVDFWWVSDRTGGICFIDDYFFDCTDMVRYLQNRCTRKKMFEDYENNLRITNGY